MKRLLVGALVVAVGLMILPAFVAPGPSTQSRVIGLAPIVGSAIAVVFFTLAIANAGPARPPGFVVRPGGPSFEVPASRAYGFTTVALLALAANGVGVSADAWAHPDFTGQGGRIGLAFVVFGTVFIAVWVVFVARWIVGVFRGSPMLELTPRGLVVWGPVGTRLFPWDALRPGTPVRGYEMVTLVVDRPELVRWGGPKWLMRRIVMGYAFVHPWFFADAVRLYVLRSERRAAIGTPEEYARLLVDLGVLVPLD